MTTLTSEDVRAPNPNKRFECPVCHSSRCVEVSRSSDDKLLAKCHAGKCDVYGHIKSKFGLPDWAQRKTTEKSFSGPERISRRQEDDQKFERAMKVLRASKKASVGQPTEYLASRGITKVPTNAHARTQGGLPRDI
jgi:hypothetical protein